MKLSVFTDYSLRVLMYSATKTDKLVTTKEIGLYYNISYNHLVKVVHKLSTAGYLKIRKGNGGGFQLARAAEEIKLGEVVRAMEPDFNFVECFDAENNKCSITPFCKMKQHISEAFKAFLMTLDKTSIADVVKENRHLW